MPAPRPSRVVFLESQQGLESLFTRGLRSGAVAAGWETEVVFLANGFGSPRSLEEVRADLLRKETDTICFLMDAPCELEDLWNDPRFANVDKISLWFDDYSRSSRTLARPDLWTAWQKNHSVRVGIWDGYWRHRWKKLTGVEAFPVHLAADPDLFYAKAEPWNRAWRDRAVFIGTIPSLQSLDAVAQVFPVSLRKLLEDICTAMRAAPWPLRPYEAFAACRSALPAKHAVAVDAVLRNPTVMAFWNQLLWRWGKRIARLRGIAAVGQAGPIAILSGHGTELYAGREELSFALPEGIDWVHADTREVPATVWSSLFRTGKYQFQVTDPQSIEGGLPFRVFECGACGAPLLSDHRRELAELFPEGSGVFTAPDEAALQKQAALLFAMSQRDLEEQGRNLHRTFLAAHTWEIRWRQIAQKDAPRPVPILAAKKMAEPRVLQPA